VSSSAETLSRLETIIRPRRRIVTAFSGGVDSTLVAVVARKVLGKTEAPAVIGDSASLPRSELAAAQQLAAQWDLDLIEAAPGEQDDPAYRANAPDRCYHCKSHLYETLQKVAEARAIPFIANGTNLDDLDDIRPGLRAADEAQVISPLLDAGMTKADVRAVAQLVGLPNADKPASACLASRIPFGTEVTTERLAMVEAAEAILQALGFAGVRVRHHEQVARIEVSLDQVARLFDASISAQVIAKFNEVGFAHVAVDLAGYHSGSTHLSMSMGAKEQGL
jgi:uncharacterized protein